MNGFIQTAAKRIIITFVLTAYDGNDYFEY